MLYTVLLGKNKSFLEYTAYNVSLVSVSARSGWCISYQFTISQITAIIYHTF